MSCWHPYCAVGVPADAITAVFSTVYSGGPTAELMPSIMMLLSLLLLSSLILTAFLLLLASMLCWWSFCPFIPAFVSSHDIAVILTVACCWRYCCCLRHCYCLHLNCGRYSCCCWHPFSIWWVAVAGLLAIAGIPGLARCFWGSFRTRCCNPADSGVPILAGGFKY